MKNLILLLCCLFLGCFGGGTRTPTGGVSPGPATPGSVADGGGASAPGAGVGDAAAAGPTEGVAPVEDQQDIEESSEYVLKAVDDKVASPSGGQGLPIHSDGKVVMKGLVEKLATLDGQTAFDGPYAIAPAGEKVLLVLFSDPSAEVVDCRACVTTLTAVDPVTAETSIEEALKRRNLDVTFSGYDGWYVRLFAIPWTDTGSIVDCQKKLVSVPGSLSALEEPDAFYLSTLPLVGSTL